MFLTDNPQKLASKGEVADVPFVTGMIILLEPSELTEILTVDSGDCDDEGTLFSLSTLNIT